MAGARVVVIGGGIAGLSAGLRLSQAGLSPHILEAGDRPGGVLATHHLDGLVLEDAANGFLSGPPDGALVLAEELGVSVEATAPEAARRWIYFDGELHDVPLSPAALMRTDLLSRSAKLRMLGEPLFGRGPVGETVHRRIARRLGNEVADNLVAPFVIGVFAGDARTLGADDAFPFLTELDHLGGVVRLAARRLRGPRGPRPRTMAPSSGVGALVSAVADRLGRALELGARVQRIRRDGASLVVERDGGQLEPADVVVLATPPGIAAQLMAEMDATLAESLAGIPRVSVAVVHLVFERSQVDHALDGFGFLVRDGEPTSLLGCVFETSLWPSRASRGRVILRCMHGGHRDPEAVEMPSEVLVRRSLDVLCPVLGVRGEPSQSRVTRWPAAIPQYRPGHREQVMGMDERAQGQRVVLAGSAYHGIAVNDCIADARRVTRRVQSILAGAAVAAVATAVVACSSGPSHAPTNPGDAGRGGSTALAPATRPAPSRASQASSSTGTLSVSVIWREPPAALVREGGADGCGLPRRAALDTEADGAVPGAVVQVDRPAPERDPEPAALHVEDCRLGERLAVIGEPPWIIEVTNRDFSAHRVTLHAGDELLGELPLRVHGHTLSARGDRAGLLRVEVDGALAGHLWTEDGRQARMTNGRGVAQLSELAPGPIEGHVVYAPVGGVETARVVPFEADIEAGKSTVLTIDLGAPP